MSDEAYFQYNIPKTSPNYTLSHCKKIMYSFFLKKTFYTVIGQTNKLREKQKLKKETWWQKNILNAKEKIHWSTYCYKCTHISSSTAPDLNVLFSKNLDDLWGTLHVKWWDTGLSVLLTRLLYTARHDLKMAAILSEGIQALLVCIYYLLH